jgi:hypothetical protein
VTGFRGEIRTGKIVTLSRKNKKQEFRVAWVGAEGSARRIRLGCPRSIRCRGFGMICSEAKERQRRYAGASHGGARVALA